MLVCWIGSDWSRLDKGGAGFIGKGKGGDEVGMKCVVIEVWVCYALS